MSLIAVADVSFYPIAMRTPLPNPLRVFAKGPPGSQVTFPNLVIAGAPKCGTTSLFRWLADHPQTCGSKTKEPFFLMDRDHPLRRLDCNYYDHGLDAYSKYFEHCRPNHKVVMEATTHYIYQMTAPKVLASLEIRPKILFVLRKPSEQLFSAYNYSRNNRGTIREDLTFSEFIQLMRCSSDTICTEHEFGKSSFVLSRQLKYCLYVDYLITWRELFNPDQIRIVIFENMKSDPKGTIKEICVWLGIDTEFYDRYDFPIANPTVGIRYRKLHRVAVAVGRALPTGWVKTASKKLYIAAQQMPPAEAPSAADKAVMAQLDEEFRPSIERLKREFGLQLDVWE